jgi:hypothetical protein
MIHFPLVEMAKPQYKISFAAGFKRFIKSIDVDEIPFPHALGCSLGCHATGIFTLKNFLAVDALICGIHAAICTQPEIHQAE